MPQFPHWLRRGRALAWLPAWPPRLNSCFVPAALVGRCSGKANIPRPGVYRLAAPSLRLPARGTGRGAAPPPGGEERSRFTSAAYLRPLPTVLGVSARPPAAGGERGAAPPYPDGPWDALHPSAFAPPPRGSPGRTRPPRTGGGHPPPPSRDHAGYPLLFAVAPACLAVSGARGGAQPGWRAGARGGARSIPHIFNGSAEPVGCCSGDSAALRPGSSAEAGMHLLNRSLPIKPLSSYLTALLHPAPVMSPSPTGTEHLSPCLLACSESSPPLPASHRERCSRLSIARGLTAAGPEMLRR